jgi:mitogen-activated protein kinase 1/3
VDIWAIGCVFAELLGTMKESAVTFPDRKHLFPGKSCFPLSPSKESEVELKDGIPYSTNDQLHHIFQVIGYPSKQELSFVTDKQALNYLNRFKDIPKSNLAAKFPGADAAAIDFLEQTL